MAALDLTRAAALLAWIWAVVALAFQARAALAGLRADPSLPVGRAAAGVIYLFTAANHPLRKESIRGHPMEFALGVVLHVGALAALAVLLTAALRPAAGAALLARLPAGFLAALAAGLALLARRALSADLRAMSTPDDYLAAGATCGLLAAAAAAGLAPGLLAPALFYTALLLIYLPLGKLRHALFFFLARTDHGRRLGRRGVLPPAASRG